MRIFKIIGLVFFALSVFTALFINLSPQFGSNPNSLQKRLYSSFYNYVDGEFKNHEPTKLFTEEMSIANFFKDGTGTGAAYCPNIGSSRIIFPPRCNINAE